MQHAIEQLVASALAEDIGLEDLTTTATVPPDLVCRARLMAKDDGVLSGINVFRCAFDLLRAQVQDWQALEDGARFCQGDQIACFTGNARAILTAERTALNFLQHLSGVATTTAHYVAALSGLPCRVCDTRKTSPMLRQLEKQAVVHGGGANHRHSLFNGILIKENHIMMAGGVAEAIRRARTGAHHLLRVEVEVASLDEFDEALAAGADAILLDNMDNETMREAVRRAQGSQVILEASGNATLDRIRGMAETGVHLVSVGALTHSTRAVDLSLLIEHV